MHFICRSFSGNSESKSWSRYWENDPDDPSLKSTKGHLFALININSPEEKDLSSIGHDISFEFNQNYFNSENDLDILTNLSQSVDSIIKNPLYTDYKIDFMAVVVVNDQLYLATFGESKIVFKRQDGISILLDSFDSKIETLTGSIKNQDRIFLLTNSFFEKITWKKIKQFLSDPKVENIEENFLSAIYSLDDQKNLAAAFIEIESEDEQIPVVVEDNDQSVSSEPVNLEPIVPESTPVIKKSKFNFSKIFQIFKKIKKDNSVFVSHHQTKEVDKRKKISLLIGLLLIIGLSLSIYCGFRKNKNQKIENQYQTLKVEIEIQIENINKTKNLSLDSAREAAIVAQETIEKLIALKVHQGEIENYNAQLKTILSQTGSSKNFAPDFLYDTNNIVSNPKFQKLIFNDNKIYLLDSQNGRIDYFDINNKSTKSLLISEKIKSTINFALDKTNLYLINKEEISLIEKKDITKKITLTDINPLDFKFWNGAAYVLDSTNKTIWKFNPNAATDFSDAQNWLKNDTKLDSDAVSLAINGKIWILYKDGSIVPYSSGVKSEFKPSQDSEFTKTNNLDVTLEKELLIFIDNGNTIYLYQKTGELLSKYNLGDLKIEDIAFNEANNSIYILCSDQKIYFIKF
jgi:hypothetical protein